MSLPERVLFFDGICHVCNDSVRFIYQRDPSANIRFAQLQSPLGREVLQRNDFKTGAYDSLLYIEGGEFYTHSAAVLRILPHLRFPWPLFGVLRIVPRPLRDAVYNWIARNRYAWFGQEQQCMLPTAELNQRFVEGGIAHS
jgi:predicted DCC family thiol-disulfide oxidoreductase YuxK